MSEWNRESQLSGVNAVAHRGRRNINAVLLRDEGDICNSSQRVIRIWFPKHSYVLLYRVPLLYLYQTYLRLGVSFGEDGRTANLKYDTCYNTYVHI